MGPKKVILCVDADEQALSVRCLLLDLHGFRVLRAVSSQEALEVIAARTEVTTTQRWDTSATLDLLIAELGMLDANELVRRAKQASPGLPCLITSRTVDACPREMLADYFLPKDACGSSVLVDKVRDLVARKRGPKKRPHVDASVGAALAGAAVNRPEVAA